ncbi:MAG: asparagine synthase (glutamine-hydrolyzing) [Candidatus Micrarchaeota archaeon]|nr:asparagine synthase (glutamine-hydrolyzing) [Candidatus Micrarchaeota archaeon]
MCGIAGILGSSDKKTVRRMTDAIRHRGPDSSGFFCDKGISLGMRRLSIIDLKTGDQPIFNEEGDIAVVFNGEIYNYREIRSKLEKKGHKFSTNSDTEVIPHLYEEFGENFVSYLNGMFAFALWDSNKNQLLLARDRLGIKPLYYYHDVKGKRLAFASELKSLLKSGLVKKKLNQGALSSYLRYGYVPAPVSIFENVQKLPPGHMMIADAKSARVTQYWDVDFRKKTNESGKALEEKLVGLLRSSVKMELISDVPLGAFLSGGIDSSLVVGLMSEFSEIPVRTFSVGFEGESEFTELDYARIASEAFGTRHYELLVSQKNVIDSIEKLAFFYDEPFADPSAVPTYMVSGLARRHVKVVLSGDGGDEAFGGYDRYTWDSLAGRMEVLPHPIRGAASAIASTLAHKIPLRFLQNASRFAKWATLEHPERYSEMVSVFAKAEIEGMGFAPPRPIHVQTPNAGSGADRLFYTDIKTYLPDDILVKVDRASMAHSLEARPPLLDHRIMEFSASLPASEKLGLLSRKLIFKRAIRELLPPQILKRKKMGFAVPIRNWLKSELGEYAANELEKTKLADARMASSLLEQHKSGGRDNAYKIWTLLILEKWAEKFMP